MTPSPRSGVILSTYVSAQHANELRSRAEAADRSIAAEIRRALRDYLAPTTSIGHAGNVADAKTDGAGVGHERL